MTASDPAGLLASLTLEEKASLCSGSDFWHTQAILRVGIESIMLTDGPHGLRKQTDQGDHLGLGTSVPATCFPTAAALGASWDVDLVRRVGEALGAEARAEHVAVLLGPGINIKRTPLCGRNFEYLSEDPVHSAELAAAHVDARASAPRSSISRPTTRRPTACGSVPRWTSAPCGRSIWPRSSTSSSGRDPGP